MAAEIKERDAQRQLLALIRDFAAEQSQGGGNPSLSWKFWRIAADSMSSSVPFIFCRKEDLQSEGSDDGTSGAFGDPAFQPRGG